jgi:DNA-binding MarR family transcriptional regulator
MITTNEEIAREVLDIVPAIMRTIRVEMRSQRSADLAIPQFRSLLYIHRNPHCSLKTLAHHLGLTPPTVSKMVDGMVLKQLISRETSPRDRRKITLVITEQGNEILEKAREGTQTCLTEIFSELTPDETHTVFQAMRLLHTLFLPS